MSTPHINAKKNDISDIVIMSGDPIRVKYISERYLKNIIKINSLRLMLGFTGNYKNRRISIMSHGMGIPSCAIYIKELITEYNVKNIIRVGTCGTIRNDVELRDIIVGMGASTDSNFNRLRFNGNDFSAIASFKLLLNIVKSAKKLNIKISVGNLFTTDCFYSQDKKMVNILEKYGFLGVEMETAGIYSLAAEHRIEAISICTVTDHLKHAMNVKPKDRESTLDEMIQIALESTLLL
ncbi:MAG TPA: purine-nucleoside phosphorylase [Buchnera sp. (in: enterobacteria)]|nr:purine-nucleoside phosphorylase [Buchnera sp. (in: enterobacteria)]